MDREGLGGDSLEDSLTVVAAGTSDGKSDGRGDRPGGRHARKREHLIISTEQ